jgi:hypothetical protein
MAWAKAGAGMSRWAAGLALLLLAGCGDTPAADLLRRPAPPPAAAPVQGPALIVGQGRPQVVLRPVQQSGARQLWRGENNVALATEGARIVGTAGFGQMLTALRLDGPDPLEDPRALAGRQASARRSVDLQGAGREAESMVFGLALDCTLQGEATAGVLLVQERCTGREVAFTNRFWFDAATGAPLRAEQWVGTEAAALSVEWRGP